MAKGEKKPKAEKKAKPAKQKAKAAGKAAGKAAKPAPVQAPVQLSTAAIALLFVGFLFTFYAIPLFGVDLLIDAVGYVFIFNAARGLRKTGAGFKLAPTFSFLLVLICAVQMFLSGGNAVLAGVPRAFFELLLFFSLGRGFGRSLAAESRRLWLPAALCRATLPLTGVGLLAAAVVPCLNLLGQVLSANGQFWATYFLSVVVTILQLLVLALLAIVFVVLLILHYPVPSWSKARAAAVVAEAELESPPPPTSPLNGPPPAAPLSGPPPAAPLPPDVDAPPEDAPAEPAAGPEAPPQDIAAGPEPELPG